MSSDRCTLVGRYIPPEVAARLAEHLGDEDLTTRELEVLRLIRDGYRKSKLPISWQLPRPPLISTSRTSWISWGPMTERTRLRLATGAAYFKSDAVSMACRYLQADN